MPGASGPARREWSPARLSTAGAESGLFRSTNGGRAWREVDFPLDDAPVLSLAVAENGTIFAGTESRGLYRSGDRGRTWEQIGSEQIAAPVNALVIAPDSSLWALLSDSLIVSNDARDTWTAHNTPIEEPMTALLVDGIKVIVGLANGDLITL